MFFLSHNSVSESNLRMTHEQLRICNHSLQPGECVKIVAFAGNASHLFGKHNSIRICMILQHRQWRQTNIKLCNISTTFSTLHDWFLARG